jgi:pyruvate formate lyase activating enzyme
MNYLLKLDTNGSRPEIVETLLKTGLCDYFAVDYKAPQKRYTEICGRGADAGKVLDTIGLLQKAQVDFEVRTTVFPQLTEADLLTMAAELPQLPRYVLNRYRKPETYLPEDEQRVNQPPYTPKQVEALAEQVRKLQPNVTV